MKNTRYVYEFFWQYKNSTKGLTRRTSSTILVFMYYCFVVLSSCVEKGSQNLRLVKIGCRHDCLSDKCFSRMLRGRERSDSMTYSHAMGKKRKGDEPF
jgi:hypothetical protein